MSPDSTCPVCGFSTSPEQGEAPPDNCAQCGTMLINLDIASTVEKVNVMETKSPVLRGRMIDLRPAIGWALVFAFIFAAASGLLALLLLPLLGLSIAAGVPAAAYFGALIGVLFGFLWKALDDLEKKRLWGLVLGAAVGLIAGLVNFVVLRAGGYLPEVSPYEHILFAFFAGSVGGTFIGAFKAED